MAQPGKAGELGSWEPVIRVGRQEPPAGKERYWVTATLSLLSFGLRSAPILFGFECLRIVLEGNTDSFVIFGGVEQTGLSSFRPAAHLQGETVVGCTGGDRGCLSVPCLLLWAPQASVSDVTLSSSGAS